MMTSDSFPTALIAGALRGLGLALAAEFLKRGWHVIATAREDQPAALQALQSHSEQRLRIEPLELNDIEQIRALRARLSDCRLDVLFVNAGISHTPNQPVGAFSRAAFEEVMVTNALSPMRVLECLQDLVKPSGCLGVMSSSLGSVSANHSGGWEVYRASKAALNTLMRSFFARHAADPRAMIIMDPGWVRTDMGGPQAPLAIEDSIPRVVDILISQRGQSGLQYLNYLGATVPW